LKVQIFTIATGAFRDATVHGHTTILQTLEIFLGVLRPAGLLCLTFRFVAEVEADLVSLVQVSLQVNVGVCLRKFFLLYSHLSAEILSASWTFSTYGCNEVDIEVVPTERTLKVFIGDIRDGLAVDLESLDADVNFERRKAKVR
jgi:hypothetical protein